MNFATKITVIIPFYNAKNHLKRSVDSVLSQTFQDFEIILINDGSSDESVKIANSFVSSNEKISVISIPNSGPGIARNKGVANAKSEYIVFLDADDELPKNALQDLLTCIITNESDLCIGMHTMNTASGKTIKTARPFNDAVLTGTKTIEAVLKNNVIPTSWAKIYKTKIAKKTLFPNLFWKEDDVFILNYLSKVHTVSFLNKVILINNCNSDSLTRQLISPKMIRDIFNSFSLQEKLIPSHFKEDFIVQQIQVLVDLFLILKIDSKHLKDNKKAIETLLAKRTTILLSMKHNNLKKRLILLFLNWNKYIGISPILFLLSLIKYKQLNNLRRIKT